MFERPVRGTAAVGQGPHVAEEARPAAVRRRRLPAAKSGRELWGRQLPAAKSGRE